MRRWLFLGAGTLRHFLSRSHLALLKRQVPLSLSHTGAQHLTFVHVCGQCCARHAVK